MENSTILLWIGILGIFVGFRALLPLAMLSFFAWRVMLPLPPRWNIFGQTWMFIILAVLATLELCADKWRGMPNRTNFSGLAPRFISGGLCGALLSASTALPWWKGAAVCAVLTVLGASLGYSLRQYFREATRTQDLYMGVIEDCVTLIGAWWVLSQFG